MEGKLKIQYDFDLKEPFIEIKLCKPSQRANQDEDIDLRDSFLKHFVQEVTTMNRPLFMVYPSGNTDNSVVKIMLGSDPTDLQTKSDWPFEYLFPGRLIWVLHNGENEEVYTNWKIVVFQEYTDKGNVNCSDLGGPGLIKSYKRWSLTEPTFAKYH